MKIFNKNRKSFGNNNNRRNDRNNSYRSNDRNNKFGRKNGGRNKFIKSEQFHEEEDATPWHVMKQNLKPSIAIKNPEIEDDWNAGGKQKSNAAKQEFMRQKDERHRKFVIENERKTISKWDSFSDVEQSQDEDKRTNNTNSDESDVKQIVENELMECEIKETGSGKKSSKKMNKLETSEDHASKKTKLKHKKVSQENTIVEDENSQPAIIKKKSKKNAKHVESSQELNIDTLMEQPEKKKFKKTAKLIELPQELNIDIALEQPVKKKSKKTVEQGVSPQEIIIENAIKSNTVKKQSKKKDKQAVFHDQTELPPVPEISFSNKNEKKTLNTEKPEESFLESLAAQKQNEPLLFESTEIMKSGPRCFACRQFGHSLKQCRDFDNTSSRICIKCGSNEHAYQNCTVHKGRVFKFASCFICKQTGHISSQCKEKKNGVYPDGGNCRYCSSIEHLGFNCPRRPGRKKKRKFTKNHNSKPNDKFRKVQAGGGGGGRRGDPGKIQKDNQIKKNFK